MKRITIVVPAMVVWLLGFSTLPATTGDVGTAIPYDPPYLPIRCKGYTRGQFIQGYFVAAGDGIWDKGAACGRKYRMRCISGVNRPCKGDTIVVEVADVCRMDPCPSTFIMSNKAFHAISNIPHTKINVEFVQI